MKKLFVVCGLALLSVMPASAQFAWGIRGGLNVVNNDIKAVTSESLKSKDNYTGMFFGPMAEFTVPIIGVGVDVSLLYSQKGLQMAEGENMKNQSIAVPLNLKYSFGLGNFLAIFAQAGAQFDYKFGDLEKQYESVKAGDATKGEVSKFILEQNTWSANIGAGVKLINHIQAAVNYNIPLTKEGTHEFYNNVQGAGDGNFKDLKSASDKASDAFKTSTLQFILTWTF